MWDDLNTKALKFSLNELKTSMERYCLYTDLKDLYAKVVPPVEKFQGQMVVLYSEHE